MRVAPSEKQEIIRIVERSELGVNRTLKELGIHKSTFYKWYRVYEEKGMEGLLPQKKTRQQWNSIPESQKQLVVEVALDHPVLSPRELSVKITDEQKIFISESSVYRILKLRNLITTPAYILMSASNEFKKKTRFVHELWQTDFTYFKILGWGWYYLSTILDDYSRYIIYWELCKTMAVQDVERSVDRALDIAGLQSGQRPKLLSDHGSCYIAAEFKEYLLSKGVKPIHGKINHPQTQGKIERYHRSMKNIVNLDHYYCPDELIEAVGNFVNYYNYKRYHESLENVTPADVYWGKKEQILRRREKIKIQNMRLRRALYATEKLNNI
ncbi:Helix-turn-helix, Fis-type protein [Candidatus Desulfosporosinus infrequens]|uniref:Helix-turn-helix, Fis-type protein n=1 Tax=Candidatus Desulfosporosinus infrequens TaxID=2043169 RepID=A0A2U3LD55_9FIRM|nr:Helix-turn-helix, Fis-type protein [Candidatus Desulfosporosinus infrequens]